MVSSFPSYDEELLNSAYANISLIADKAWTFDAGNPFRKLNRSLWIQNCKLTAKYKENGTYRPRRVRDVIPDSRLATYGDYEYNEEHEAAYRAHDDATSVPRPNFCWTEVTEPWMLPEVEERFAWLTAGGVRANRELLASQRKLPRSRRTCVNLSAGELILQSSAVRVPDPEDASKMGHGFELRWEESAQSQRKTRKSSPTRKSHESRSESRLNKDTNLIEPDPDQKFACYAHRRYTIENPMEMQLHVRVTSEAIRSLWKSGTGQQQFPQQRTCSHQPATNQREPNWQGKDRQQQFYYTLQYRPLILRTEYQAARTETYGIPRKHLSPVLSPEVPEFFPKVPLTRFSGNKEQNNNRMRYFPSLNERSYQNELFPYNRTHENAGALYQTTRIPLLPSTDTTTFIRPPQQWYQRIPPPAQIQISTGAASPMCTSVQPLRATTITHHPLQVQERFLQSSPIPIPVYQHPIEMYHETGQKRKNQGADFKNLILLTRNAMKAHRGQSKAPQQKSYVLETRNRSAKSESEVLQWLDKSCPSKAKELAVDTFATELRNYERKGDRKTSSSRKEKDNSKNVERSKMEAGTCVQGSYPKSTGERDKNDGRSRKRLYRDVLANSAENQAMMENVFEKRYDELEQQAIEQYRTSEESLALKYQELERQAMEQYGCCGNATEEGSTSQASADHEEISDVSTKTIKDANCSDGRKCSGFGRCSPVNSNEKDPFPQDKFAQTENKSETDAVDNRSSVLSATVSQKVYYESKNTSKGASGDKIDENVSVRASSKRRLILVSPYEKRSEARLTRTTDLEEFYCIAQTNKNIFDYYNNTKIGKLGGGDENITIIQSPRTEVWLSGFWTT